MEEVTYENIEGICPECGAVLFTDSEPFVTEDKIGERIDGMFDHIFCLECGWEKEA